MHLLLKLRNRLPIGMAIIVLAFCIWLWFDVLEDRWFPKNWGEVVPGQVYRSGQLSPWLIEQQLQSAEIDLIIDLNRPVQKYEQRFEEQTARQLSITHHRFGLYGNGTGKPEHLVDAVVELARAYRQGQKVLVHCTAGAQRTGGVIAAFELLVLNKPPHQVIKNLQHYGWNPQQDKVLLEFINQNLPKIAQALQNQQLIPPISAFSAPHLSMPN